MSGATILPTFFTISMNIIKITIATNPALPNFLAYEILSSNAKKRKFQTGLQLELQLIQIQIYLETQREIKTILLGVSKCLKSWLHLP
jgi:hypothetical protein